MRTLSLGTDRKLFEEGSAVRMRQHAYAESLGELHIIVGSCRNEADIHEGNLHIYSTHSVSRFLYWFGMIRLGLRIPQPDVVTVQDPFETGFAGLVLSWKMNVPLHVQVHTDPFASEFASSFLNRVRQICARYVLRRATRVRVVSERVKESLSRITDVPVTVLPLFVALEKFEQVPRTKHPRFKISFLCIGRFEKEKRFDRAIDVLVALRKNGHDAGLTLVGSGMEEQYLRTYAREKGVEAQCVFRAWTDDIRSYLAEADALLVTSEYEGYGLVIVEALAAGVPVLSRDVGIAQEAGALVIRGDFTQGVLSWALHGPRMGNLALTLIRSFDEYVDAWANDVRTCVTRKND